MRFFIAVEIPEESKERLRTAQQQLKAIIPQARLTDNDKLHLTIAFVGEQPDTLADNLTNIIKEAAQGVSSFTVTPAYLDGFPHLHNAHTLWIGIKGDTDKLFLLRHRIKDGLIKLGLPVDERRYTPHIAIAKLNHLRLTTPQEERLQQIMQLPVKPIQVSSIKLFESIPEDGFHTHNTLAEIPLGN